MKISVSHTFEGGGGGGGGPTRSLLGQSPIKRFGCTPSHSCRKLGGPLSPQGHTGFLLYILHCIKAIVQWISQISSITSQTIRNLSGDFTVRNTPSQSQGCLLLHKQQNPGPGQYSKCGYDRGISTLDHCSHYIFT